MHAVVAAVICTAVGFALGIIFHKNVVSESAQIKAHVTAEAFNIRVDVKNAIEKGLAAARNKV